MEIFRIQVELSLKDKTTWDMIRKINGKGKSNSVNHLNKGNEKVTSVPDIANTLADAFSRNSSSDHYSEEFLKVKTEQERTRLNLAHLSKANVSYSHRFSSVRRPASVVRRPSSVREHFQTSSPQ